jgi:hypothetical protein
LGGLLSLLGLLRGLEHVEQVTAGLGQMR